MRCAKICDFCNLCTIFCFLIRCLITNEESQNEDGVDKTLSFPLCVNPMNTEFSLSRFHETVSELAKMESLKLSTVLSMFNEITLLFRTIGLKK